MLEPYRVLLHTTVVVYCRTSKETLFFSNCAKPKHNFKINSDKHEIRLRFICWIENEWFSFLKLDIFVSKVRWLHNSKETNWRANPKMLFERCSLDRGTGRYYTIHIILKSILFIVAEADYYEFINYAIIIHFFQSWRVVRMNKRLLWMWYAAIFPCPPGGRGCESLKASLLTHDECKYASQKNTSIFFL